MASKKNKKMDKKIVLFALVFGFIAIAFGAFGAHGLKKVLTTEQLSSFEVGIRYLMYHAMFLLFLGTTQMILPEQKYLIFWLTIWGTVLFSGSIFLLTTSGATGINFKFLGPITPIGGLLLLAAWAMLFIRFFKKL
jgi:uncharacterized membrane protein YgdD (TMEM256/DUF423 family)